MESPGGLVKAQIAEPSRVSDSVDLEVNPKNLHV